MKKILFWFLLLAAALLLSRIFQTLYYDLHRLSEYGLGYLVGMIILLVVISGIAILLGFKLFRKNRTA
jgi:uncharacterized protein HemY